MGGGQHRHDLRIGVHLGLGILPGQEDVGIQGPIRDHHAFRESGSAGSIVDQGQFVRLILVIGDVIGAETLGEGLRKGIRQLVPDRRQLVVPRIQVLQGIHLHDDMQARHLRLGQALPDHLVHEKDLRLGVVDQIMDVTGLELVQDGHRHRAIGHGSQETHAPVGLVAGAEGHLVAFLQAAFLEIDMQMLDTPGDILVAQRHALVVGQGLAFPIFLETLLKQFVD